MALSQTDIDRLELAIAKGVKTVKYSDGEVTYQSTTDMMRALDYAKQQVASASSRRPPSSFGVFDRC